MGMAHIGTCTRTWRWAAAAALLPWLPAAAHAAQLSDAYATRVRIETSCSVTAADLDFGPTGIIIANQTASATVQVVCSGGIPFALSFSPSSIATSFAGQMVNGANHVSYNATLIGSNSGVGSVTRSIRGTLPGQPTPPPGLYTDNRTLYLNY